jgi:hypothetical protein
VVARGGARKVYFWEMNSRKYGFDDFYYVARGALLRKKSFSP